MSTYPRELTSTDISPRLASLVRELATLLLDGPTPGHRALQVQLADVDIERINLTGAGLYADFRHPASAVSVSPPELIGGQVVISFPELDAPAGSLIKVSKGLLAFLEIYTVGDFPWPDEPPEATFSDVIPLPIPMRAI